MTAILTLAVLALVMVLVVRDARHPIKPLPRVHPLDD